MTRRVCHVLLAGSREFRGRRGVLAGWWLGCAMTGGSMRSMCRPRERPIHSSDTCCPGRCEAWQGQVEAVCRLGCDIDCWCLPAAAALTVKVIVNTLSAGGGSLTCANAKPFQNCIFTKLLYVANLEPNSPHSGHFHPSRSAYWGCISTNTDWLAPTSHFNKRRRSSCCATSYHWNA